MVLVFLYFLSWHICSPLFVRVENGHEERGNIRNISFRYTLQTLGPTLERSWASYQHFFLILLYSFFGLSLPSVYGIFFSGKLAGQRKMIRCISFSTTRNWDAFKQIICIANIWHYKSTGWLRQFKVALIRNAGLGKECESFCLSKRAFRKKTQVKCGRWNAWAQCHVRPNFENKTETAPYF